MSKPSTMQHFSPFGNATWKLLSFLSVSLNGGLTVTLKASKQGLTLKMGSLLTAHGKTPEDLCNDYDLRAAELMAKLNNLKAELAEKGKK